MVNLQPVGRPFDMELLGKCIVRQFLFCKVDITYLNEAKLFTIIIG